MISGIPCQALAGEPAQLESLWYGWTLIDSRVRARYSCIVREGEHQQATSYVDHLIVAIPCCALLMEVDDATAQLTAEFCYDCRMVLDHKATSLHSDYGSFDRPLAGGEGQERDVEAAVDGSSTGMAQSSDVYQRQPLLPGAPVKGKDRWGGVGSSSDYYEDDEHNKIDEIGHARHSGVQNGSGSGIVKLDIPAPLREEPRFPKEKWKTLLGNKSEEIYSRLLLTDTV